MTKKSKKSVYKCGGKLQNGGPVDLTKFAGLTNIGGQLLQSTNSPIGNIGGGILSGAANGAPLGPWGAIAGGAMGLIGGVMKAKQANEAEALQNKVLMQQANIQSLNNSQNANKMYQNGGDLEVNPLGNQITQYNGLQHEEGGLPIGNNTEVENNETRGIGTTEDYVFSDTLKPDRKSKKTFADLSKDIEKRYKNYDSDRIAKKSKDRELAFLMHEQEALKKSNMEKDVAKLAAKYPELFQQLGSQTNQVQNPIEEQMEGSMSNSQEESQELEQGDMMKSGGKIYIKPENRGKFNATKARTGKTTEELTHSKNPVTRKRAIFAQNAAKWKHEYGGYIDDRQLGGFIGDLNYLDGGGSVPSNLENDLSTLNKTNDIVPNLNAQAYTSGPQDYFANNLTGSVPTNIKLGSLDGRGLPGDPTQESNGQFLSVDKIKTPNYNFAMDPYTGYKLNSISNPYQNNLNIASTPVNNIQPNLNEYKKIWGNNPNFNPEVLQGNDEIDNVLFSSNGLAYNPEFVKRIPEWFKEEDMPGFREYYKNLPGNTKEYSESYQNIINNVINKSVNEVDPKTGRINEGYYKGTELLTLPSLIKYIAQNKFKKGIPPQLNESNTGYPGIESQTAYPDESLIYDDGTIGNTPSGNITETPIIEGTVPNNPLEYQGYNVGQKVNNFKGEVPSGLNPFKPNWLMAGLTALPNIGSGIGSAILAKNLKYNRADAAKYEPDYVDPTRAIQETRNQYAGIKDLIRQNAGGTGSYLSNMLGATAGQTERESGIQSQYDNINAGIYNQAAQFNTQNRQQANLTNAQIGMQEVQDKIGLKQNAISNIASGVSQGLTNYQQSKRDADMMNIAGGENFYYKSVGPRWNQTPVKVFKGNGFSYYEDPNDGRTVLMDEEGKVLKENSLAYKEAERKLAKKKSSKVKSNKQEGK